MAAINARFIRKHPSTHYERDGLPDGWFAIRHDHLPEKQDRRSGHGRWFKIKSKYATIYRVPKFANRLASEVILLDWQGWLDLNGRRDGLVDELDLTIVPLKWGEIAYLWPFIAHSFPNAGYRLANYIAIALGAISIILGVASFFS